MQKLPTIYNVFYENDLEDQTYRDEYYYINKENAIKKYEELCNEHNIKIRNSLISEGEGERVYLTRVIIQDLSFN